MALVDRARNILLQPASEWPAIGQEPATAGSIYGGYLLPLALIPAVAGVVGSMFKPQLLILESIVTVVALVFTLGLLFVFGLIADALAPSFGGQRVPLGGLKLAGYAYTPIFIVGALKVLDLVPIMGAVVSGIGTFAAIVYGVYLLYLGAGSTLAIPQDKAAGYTAVLVLCEIALALVVSVAIGILVGILAVALGVAAGAFR